MNRFYEAMQILLKGGNRPNSEVGYDDKVPFIGTELDDNEILSLIKNVKDLSIKRKEKIDEYKYMAKDGILGSVLELVSDESSIVDEIMGLSYWVESSNKEFEKYINNWLKETIKINTFSWRLAHDFAQFGEVYLRTFNNEDKARKYFKIGDWFELMPDPLSVSDLRMFNTNLGYQYVNPQDPSTMKIYDSTEFLHIYRDLGECDYVKAKYIDKEGNVIEDDVQVVYGTSFLESSRQAFFVLDLLDTMLLSTRVNRSQLVRLIKTEVGASSIKDTRRIISEIKQAFRVSSLNLNKSYKESNINSTIQNVYIPVRNGKGDTNVEELGGNADIRDIADIEYYTDKLIASTRVPKAFLGLDSTLTAGLGQNSLTRVDIRYARLIKSIKSLVCDAVQQMVQFKISKTKFNKEKFIINTVPVSTAEENELYQAYSEKMNFIVTLKDLLSESDKIDKEELLDYALDYLLNLPEYDRFFSLNNKDVPEEDRLSTNGGMNNNANKGDS